MSADLAEEQRHVDLAYACLDAMRARVEAVLGQARRDADTNAKPDQIAIERALVERLGAVADSKAPLTFGRIDEGPDRYYIGRRHVEDHEGDPVVVDWRAPVAAPFYRATWADPLGLDLRRRFALEARRLIGVFDEDFSDPEADGAGGGGGVPDPLLVELERARTGEMRDIVSTIQAEQDVIIRAPLDELLIVQGGPGTGKTAVGLHRAAYLLFAHRAELERRKLLIVGPNRVFLDYIGQVLPSLGEAAGVQTTIETLMARTFPVRGSEPPELARLKGDPRMAEVLRAAVVARIRPPDDDAQVMTAFGLARFPYPAVRDVLAEVREQAVAANVGREVFRDRLVALAWQIRSELPGISAEQQFAFSDDLRTQAAFKKVLDAWWPAMSPAPIVRSVLGSAKVLAVAGRGLLDDAERRLLHRRPAAKASDERWTRADLGLLDEVGALTAGDHPVFGHVVVDEAQDLSAMELRMIARRAAGRSMTVLGDLAQATGVGSPLDWTEALRHLAHGSAVTGRVAELELGYRVPAPILALANRLLPIAAPHVRPARSVRERGEPPELVAVPAAGSPAAVAANRAAELASEWTTVGVLTATAMVGDVVAALERGGHRHHRSLEEGITVLEAASAKGLEFDAVVVVEPAAIADAGSVGWRILYVALTRAVQRLCVVHQRPLPDVLAA